MGEVPGPGNHPKGIFAFTLRRSCSRASGRRPGRRCRLPPSWPPPVAAGTPSLPPPSPDCPSIDSTLSWSLRENATRASRLVDGTATRSPRSPSLPDGFAFRLRELSRRAVSAWCETRHGRGAERPPRRRLWEPARRIHESARRWLRWTTTRASGQRTAGRPVVVEDVRHDDRGASDRLPHRPRARRPLPRRAAAPPPASSRRARRSTTRRRATRRPREACRANAAGRERAVTRPQRPETASAAESSS